ncbi:DUF4054 domain-containing protein [Sphingobium fuliginis]|uniref:DUF4054 domain-containing protein n=1 Tax=Sphingobium fuliginis ATCC 27551 TaxID=1208342 RepID=A0A5B8CGG6_SPHSA|nr:DUF4054 domain-containing protein [Sphingobium fuliginis]QDC37097.1 DUF4054 domain-containing protein [Sphingobium fuliginis ATCC 27551]
MAYSAPAKDTFTGIFPAFAAVSDEAYTFWSGQAVLVTEPLQDCLGARMDLATMRATAHYLTQQGIGTGTEAQMAAQGASGFKRLKSGTLEIERGDSPAAANMGDWGTTSYGQQLYPMLKACVGGPRVSGTGCVVDGNGFNGFAGVLPPWVR